MAKIKFEIEMTHRGWIYGCPVYMAFDGNDCPVMIAMIPFTNWYLDWGVTGIQAIRAWLHPEESGGWCFSRIPLKRPFKYVFEWSQEEIDFWQSSFN